MISSAFRTRYAAYTAGLYLQEELIVVYATPSNDNEIMLKAPKRHRHEIGLGTSTYSIDGVLVILGQDLFSCRWPMAILGVVGAVFSPAPSPHSGFVHPKWNYYARLSFQRMTGFSLLQNHIIWSSFGQH